MREILFRGKTLLDKWIEGDLLQYLGDGKVHIVQHYKGAGGQEVIPETVGQYTGLTDDNGKKIFEGDILGVTNDDPDYDYITKVSFECNTLCVDVEGQDYDYTSIGFAADIWDCECDRIEVIGNIHDNPELLRSDTE